MPTPPWSPRHAAVAQPYAGALHFLTGSNYQRDHWKLIKSAPGTVRYNGTPNGVTSWGNQFTVVDRSMQLPAGAPVGWIGVLFNSAHSDVCVKVFKENSAGNYDVVYSDAPRVHPGGGVYVDCAVNFTTPSAGIYRIGFSASMTSEAFNTSGARAIKVGNISGNNQTFTAYSDGTVPMRWIEG